MKTLLLALALALPVTSYAYRVTGITDGDTLKILKDGREVSIRLAGIDAPEKNQAFGQRSKESLSDLCWGKDVQYDYALIAIEPLLIRRRPSLARQSSGMAGSCCRTRLARSQGQTGELSVIAFP